MFIVYCIDFCLIVDQFIDIFFCILLGLCCLLDDCECMEVMVIYVSLIVIVWDGELLVGVVCCVIDFVYVCYMLELVVDEQYQCWGIGKELICVVCSCFGLCCCLWLLVVFDVIDYYSYIGFVYSFCCWELMFGNEFK